MRRSHWIKSAQCAAQQLRHESIALPPQPAPQERQFDITDHVDMNLLSHKSGAVSPKQRPYTMLSCGSGSIRYNISGETGARKAHNNVSGRAGDFLT